ncbi:MAG: hypothetical protein IPF41_09025, partial [Flavobacteriales bacterium]|nr:hypothetical protein [Flavobacteriales bacterium]
VCRCYTYVVEGCLRMYEIDEKGVEHNLQFALENEWIVDIGSFHAEKPSSLFIEALEEHGGLHRSTPTCCISIPSTRSSTATSG